MLFYNQFILDTNIVSKGVLALSVVEGGKMFEEIGRCAVGENGAIIISPFNLVVILIVCGTMICCCLAAILEARSEVQSLAQRDIRTVTQEDVTSAMGSVVTNSMLVLLLNFLVVVPGLSILQEGFFSGMDYS